MLWFRVLQAQGIPSDTCKIIERLHRGAKIKIRLGEEKTSEPFDQKGGIRQGSALSPLLFVLCILNNSVTQSAYRMEYYIGY